MKIIGLLLTVLLIGCSITPSDDPIAERPTATPVLTATLVSSTPALEAATPTAAEAKASDVAPTPNASLEPKPVPTEQADSSDLIPGPAGYALRFFGTGSGDVDRVKVIIDDPTNDAPGPTADIGAEDFTLEWWMKADLVDNPAEPVECGPNNINWIFGNILIDRDRFSQDRKFGVSLAGGQIVFGLSGQGSGDYTLCSTSDVTDGQWHHIAIQRRRADGYLWLFVDGRIEAEGVGPGGDVSYPDDGRPGDFCGGPCVNSDPFLVFGAEKHDAGSEYPSYRGWLDEVRLSKGLRYSGSYSRPAAPFEADADTVALWHFDEGGGEVASDSSLGGQNTGAVKIGGPSQGPQWVISDAPLDGAQ